MNRRSKEKKSFDLEKVLPYILGSFAITPLLFGVCGLCKTYPPTAHAYNPISAEVSSTENIISEVADNIDVENILTNAYISSGSSIVSGTSISKSKVAVRSFIITENFLPVSEAAVSNAKNHIEEKYDFEGTGLDANNANIDKKDTLTSEEQEAVKSNVSKKNVLYDELKNSWDAKVSKDRKRFVKTAVEQVNKIPYYWGGKPNKKGDPVTVWCNGTVTEAGTPIREDKNGRTLSGLDCSGFVSWVYWTAFDVFPEGMSTANFCRQIGATEVSEKDLKIGDLGMYDKQGAEENHIGIYVGKDADGKKLWCHLNGEDNTVVVGNGKFKYFYKLPYN